jgi:hypothetical protein
MGKDCVGGKFRAWVKRHDNQTSLARRGRKWEVWYNALDAGVFMGMVFMVDLCRWDEIWSLDQAWSP